jgi:hypothetical protein
MTPVFSSSSSSSSYWYKENHDHDGHLELQQSLPLCCLLAGLGGILEVAATAVTAIPAVRHQRGKPVWSRTSMEYRALLLGNIAIQAIGSLLSHLVATWFGPISIVVPFFYSATLLSNMAIFGILLGEPFTKHMKVGTYVIVVAVVLLPIVGPSIQEDQQDVIVLMQQHWWAMIWFLLLLVAMTITGGILVLAAMSGPSSSARQYNDSKNIDITLSSSSCPLSPSSSSLSPSSSSSSSSPSQSSTLAGYSQQQRIFILIVARATAISINLTVSRSFILQPTQQVFLWLLFLKITSGAIYTYAIVIQSTAIVQQATFVPLNATTIIILNALTGICIWDDWRVISHWYGYACCFVLLGLGCDLLLSVPPTELSLLTSDHPAFSAPANTTTQLFLQRGVHQDPLSVEEEEDLPRRRRRSKQSPFATPPPRHHHPIDDDEPMRHNSMCDAEQQRLLTKNHNHQTTTTASMKSMTMTDGHATKSYQSIHQPRHNDDDDEDDFLPLSPDFVPDNQPTTTTTTTLPGATHCAYDDYYDYFNDVDDECDRKHPDVDDEEPLFASPTRREAWLSLLSPTRLPPRNTRRGTMLTGQKGRRGRAWTTGVLLHSSSNTSDTSTIDLEEKKKQQQHQQQQVYCSNEQEHYCNTPTTRSMVDGTKETEIQIQQLLSNNKNHSKTILRSSRSTAAATTTTTLPPTARTPTKPSSSSSSSQALSCSSTEAEPVATPLHEQFSTLSWSSPLAVPPP